jgi:hypothetical protein
MRFFTISHISQTTVKKIDDGKTSDEIGAELCWATVKNPRNKDYADICKVHHQLIIFIMLTLIYVRQKFDLQKIQLVGMILKVSNTSVYSTVRINIIGKYSSIERVKRAPTGSTGKFDFIYAFVETLEKQL